MDDPLRAYEALLTLAELELGMVEAGRIFELEEIAVRRQALTAQVPGQPPAAAKPFIERALALQQRTSALLEEAMGGALGDLARLDRGRGAVRGYAPADGADGATISRTG